MANAELKTMGVTGTVESMDSAIRSKLGWLSAIILAANLLVGVGFTETAQAAGILFIGSDVGEFSASLDDKIGKYTTSAGTITGGGNVTVSYFVNGMTVVGGDLLTGTVESHDLRTVDLNLAVQSIITADIPDLDPFKEDVAVDGVNVWHAHFDSPSIGQIRQLDPNNLGGAALNVFNLPFSVVGATIAEGNIWITDWAAQQVGTWDPGMNTFTAVVSTSPNNAGGLSVVPQRGTPGLIPKASLSSVYT